MNPWPLLLAVLVFVAGGWGGVEWQKGVDARELVAKQHAMQKNTTELLAKKDDIIRGYDSRYESQSEELTNARLQIRDLSNAAPCLRADTARMLNRINVPGIRSAPAGVSPASGTAAGHPGGHSEPVNGAQSIAADIGGFISERAAGDALAICRGKYVKLALRLNSILDFEDARDKANGHGE